MDTIDSLYHAMLPVSSPMIAELLHISCCRWSTDSQHEWPTVRMAMCADARQRGNQ